MHPAILLHGSLSSILKPVILNAGGLCVSYQSGFLRYIKWNDLEVIRMINHAVRDCDWGTIALFITNQKIEANDNTFLIEYEAQCQQGDIDFVWTCRIHGKEDSSIVFDIVGKALTNFNRNRIGFTVLHPVDTCAGRECIITHSDFRNELQQFPILISPSQLFYDVVAMSWRPSEEMEASLTFEGDTFETEDQRNWIDASFKTYCTPLSKPYPVEVEAGEEIRQSIRLQVRTHTVTVREEKLLTFCLDRKNTLPFPEIGIPLSKLPHDDETIQLLKSLQLDFLRVEMSIGRNVDNATLQTAFKMVSEVKCSLEIVLFFEKMYDFNFVKHLLPLKECINHFVILSTPGKCTDEKLIKQIVPLLRMHFPKSKVGAGTDAFFAELNRNRIPVQDVDFLTFSINPQVHAVDVDSLTENLATHRNAVNSCSSFFDGRKVHVGPVTFKMRWNPNATSATPEKSEGNELPSHVDPRQLSLYGAAWTLGSFKYLAESHTKAITFFQTCGWAGLMPHVNEPWPEEYGVHQKCVYPVYLILKEILEQKRKLIVPLLSSDPLTFDGVAFADGEGNITIVVANFSNEVQRIEIPEKVKVIDARMLNASNILTYMLYPQHLENRPSAMVNVFVDLQPFELAILRCLD